MGLEPTNGGITIHCLNHLATPAIIAVLSITPKLATFYTDDNFSELPVALVGGSRSP